MKTEKSDSNYTARDSFFDEVTSKRFHTPIKTNNYKSQRIPRKAIVTNYMEINYKKPLRWKTLRMFDEDIQKTALTYYVTTYNVPRTPLAKMLGIRMDTLSSICKKLGVPNADHHKEFDNDLWEEFIASLIESESSTTPALPINDITISLKGIISPESLINYLKEQIDFSQELSIEIHIRKES